MSNKVLIIAEAGVNHNGELKIACELCDAAKKAGADIVKFQTFLTENNVLKDCEMAQYQAKAVKEKISHWQMVKNLELDFAEFRKLKAYCEKIGIAFLSTPSEFKSLEFLVKLGTDIIKISSGEITNVPFLRKIGGLGKEIILSTGMSTLGEIEAALNVLINAGTPLKKISILHCNTEYPTPLADVNLRAMLTLKEKFHTKVGYSDHTLGIEVSVAAVALGAEIIEKHFTLDKNMSGPDHKASLDPDELRQMVMSIRNIEAALGNGEKLPTASELKNKKIARKCIIASRAIRRGERFSEENIGVKRPEAGISAADWDKILGKTAPCDFKKDDSIKI